MVMGRGEKLNDGKPSFEENSCKTVQNRDVMEIQQEIWGYNGGMMGSIGRMYSTGDMLGDCGL